MSMFRSKMSIEEKRFGLLRRILWSLLGRLRSLSISVESRGSLNHASFLLKSEAFPKSTETSQFTEISHESIGSSRKSIELSSIGLSSTAPSMFVCETGYCNDFPQVKRESVRNNMFSQCTHTLRINMIKFNY